MKRLFIRIALAAGLIVGSAGALLVVGETAAGAHTHSIETSCEAGLSVTLASYNGSAEHANSVVVKFDGATVASDADFGTSFTYSKANPDKTVDHTWSVVVVAWDSSSFNVNESGTIEACEQPPPTTTTVPPTTTTRPPPTTTTTPLRVEIGTPLSVVRPTPVVATPTFTG